VILPIAHYKEDEKRLIALGEGRVDVNENRKGIELLFSTYTFYIRQDLSNNDRIGKRDR
jgi:hypothetical protein